MIIDNLLFKKRLNFFLNIDGTRNVSSLGKELLSYGYSYDLYINLVELGLVKKKEKDRSPLELTSKGKALQENLKELKEILEQEVKYK